jgi:zinc-ribbon domain
VPERPANCSNCGSPLPSGAKFCALCGAAVQEGDTVRADVPPHETSAAPPVVQQAAPRWFGLTPPTVLLGLAVVLFVAAVVLIALANWVVGLLLLGLALLFTAGFLEAGRRKPDAPIVKASVSAVDSAWARAGVTARTYATRSSARREIARRRSEAMRLASERDGLFRRLGQTVYAGGDGTEERAAIGDVDARIAALEQEANDIASHATERVDAARLEVQPTEVSPPGGD